MLGDLTRREREVLDLLAQGLSRHEMAERLCISPATIKRHCENIYRKLSVPGRRQAVAKAREFANVGERRRGATLS